MGRNKVLSFMSQFSTRDVRASNPSSPTFQNNPAPADTSRREASGQEPLTPPASQQQFSAESRRSPGRPQEWGEGEQFSSRPVSMVQTYQPPLMEMSQDTLPELQPIFTFLNSHGNKLYQEGYFLKLDDQNSQGRLNADRTWTECFAQLVGTVLSLWDAAELDAAGQDGEVLPKFINLTDASIKMIEALPTRSKDDQPLQNVLSISTAGKNRYLLHFNSHHSLIQWTAGIRLAMYEHTTLQEAYTGALIAGKGKSLNNIHLIMAKSKFPTEDWVRVRFGAGTPWRRCWCVITPPDEKEIQKLLKESGTKRSAYDNRRPILKGDVKFYDTKKTKKARPIASLSEAYSAFAIYPQSKPLIDASTLIKVEGTITIHSEPPISTEGFVFVMPEVHPAVSGFEMMLRWLFPVFDTFALYGRPGRLIADTIDPRSLMFAMPKERRYGYLEILDVTGLILTIGSQNWHELEWRRKMKELTGRRMTAIANGSRSSRYSSRKNTRNSYGGGPSLHDSASVRSHNSLSWGPTPAGDATFSGVARTDSAPPTSAISQPGRNSIPLTRQRSMSEAQGLNLYQDIESSKFDGGSESGPPLPLHSNNRNPRNEPSSLRFDRESTNITERLSFEDDVASRSIPVRELQNQQEPTSVQPVAAPPAFAHAPGTLPASKPYHSTEMRMAKTRISHSTLSQITTGSMDMPPPGEGKPRLSNDQRSDTQGRQSEDRGVISDASARGSDDQHSHKHTSSTESTDSFRPRNERRHSIGRKALPARSSSDDGRDSTSHRVVSTNSDLDARVIDREGFGRVVPMDQVNNATIQPEALTNRQRGENSNVDDDAESRKTSESASSPQSKDIGEPYERQRPGVLRTVGSDLHSTPTNSTGYSGDIPVVNFGPTINYGANRLPGEPGSGSRLPPKPRDARAPEPDQYRGSRNRSPNRMVAWQPGMAAIGASQPGRQLTPEQFVQQRAAAAIPKYEHGRQQSQSSLQSSNAMPPLARSQSTEFLSHSHGNSDDLHQRPSSQGRLALHGPSMSDYSANLSAKELQQLAREKRAAQQAFNGQIMQNAVNQRQQAQFGQPLSQPQFGSRVMGPPQGMRPPQGMGPAPATGSSQNMGSRQGVLPYQERYAGGNTNPPPPQAQFPPQPRRLPWSPPPLASQQGGNWLPPQPRGPSPERQQQQVGPQGRGQQNYRGPDFV